MNYVGRGTRYSVHIASGHLWARMAGGREGAWLDSSSIDAGFAVVAQFRGTVARAIHLGAPVAFRVWIIQDDAPQAIYGLQIQDQREPLIAYGPCRTSAELELLRLAVKSHITFSRPKGNSRLNRSLESIRRHVGPGFLDPAIATSQACFSEILVASCQNEKRRRATLQLNRWENLGVQLVQRGVQIPARLEDPDAFDIGELVPVRG